jgi:uncharacterized protein
VIAELVEHLAKVVVRHPDAVVVKAAQKPGRVDVALHVAYDDFGRVIGKSGQTIGAFRTLAGFAGRRQGLEVTVEVVEETRRPSSGADGEAD